MEVAWPACYGRRWRMPPGPTYSNMVRPPPPRGRLDWGLVVGLEQ